MRDNSVSALTKLVMFQYDGAHLRDELVEGLFTHLHPIVTDVDEAQDIYQIVFDEVLKGNASLAKFEGGVKTMINNVKAYAVANPEAEKDILGDKGKQLLEQVIAKI